MMSLGFTFLYFGVLCLVYAGNLYATQWVERQSCAAPQGNSPKLGKVSLASEPLEYGPQIERLAKLLREKGYSFCECGKNYAFSAGGKHWCPDCPMSLTPPTARVDSE